MLLAIVAIALLVGNQPHTYLVAHPELRLLAIEDAIAPEDRELYLREGWFRPTATGDFNGDNRPDVAVVLVRREPETSLFGVAVFMAIEGRHSSDPVWAVPLDSEPLQGVSIQGSRLIPQYCTECDSNPFLRWNGAGFEANLFAVGEATTASEHSGPILLRDQPREGGRVILKLGDCVTVRILEVGPRGATSVRWFRVQALPQGQASMEGWLPETTLCDTCCIG